MSKKSNLPLKSILIIALIITGYIVFSIGLFFSPLKNINRKHETANVVLFSKSDNTSLVTSLRIDSEAIHLTLITEKNIDSKFNEFLLKNTDVLIIDRFLPNNVQDLLLLKSYINGEKKDIGLIFFGAINNDETINDDFSSTQINVISDLLPIELSSNFKVSTDDASEADYKIQVALTEEMQNQKTQESSKANVLVKHVSWTSCPLISKRMIVKTKTEATKIVESIEGDYSILSEWNIKEGGHVIVYSMVIQGYNKPFVLWPYFNYLMYVSIFHVKADFLDSNIESFSKWPYSPIPHAFEITLWFGMIGILWIISFYGYIKLRHKKLVEK